MKGDSPVCRPVIVWIPKGVPMPPASIVRSENTTLVLDERKSRSAANVVVKGISE